MLDNMTLATTCESFKGMHTRRNSTIRLVEVIASLNLILMIKNKTKHANTENKTVCENASNKCYHFLAWIIFKPQRNEKPQ